MRTQLTGSREAGPVAAPEPPAGDSRTGRRIPDRVKSALGFLLLVLAYWAARASGLLPERSTPSLRVLAGALADGLSGGPLLEATGTTVWVALQGLALALVVGLPLGSAIGLSRWTDAFTRVTVEYLRPIPVVALVPVAILVFGLETEMQVFLIALACLWPVVVAARHAVRAVDPLWLDTARMLGLGRWAALRRVVLPAAIPGFATGLRTSAGVAIVVAVAIQIVSGSPGLGRYIAAAQAAGDSAATFAGVVVAGILGMLTNIVLVRLERLLAGWQSASTEGRRA
jgi:NitT/TauT family transport system permease protein